MKRVMMWLGIVVVVSLVMPVVGLIGDSEGVRADEVLTYAIAQASWINEANANTGYGSSTDDLWIKNAFINKNRGVFILPKPSDTTGISKIELLLKYDNYLAEDPVGEAVVVRRLTRAFVENDVTWNSYQSGSAWTIAGGDYTTANQREFNMPSSYGTITVDVTGLVEPVWSDGGAFYGIIMFVNENGGSTFNPEFSYDGGNGNKYRITYSESLPDPGVTVTVDARSWDGATFGVTPALMGHAAANVSVQYYLEGEAEWGQATAWVEVTTDAKFQQNVTSLEHGEKYFYRGRISVGGDTWYSSTKSFWTLAGPTPTVGQPSVNVTGLLTADVSVNYTLLGASYGFAYLQMRWGAGSWYEVGPLTVEADGVEVWDVEADWVLSIIEGTGGTAGYFQVRSRMLVGGVEYWSAGLGDWEDVILPAITASVAGKGPDWFDIDWALDMGEATSVELEMEWKRDQQASPWSAEWLGVYVANDSGTVEARNLRDLVEYFYRFEMKVEGVSIFTSWSPVWTTGLVVVPIVETIGAVFVAPYYVDFQAYVKMNDAAGIAHALYFEYREVGETNWYTTTRATLVLDGQNDIRQRLGILPHFGFGKQYEFRAVFVYIGGSVRGTIMEVHVPVEGMSVQVQDVRNITTTTATVRFEVVVVGVPGSLADERAGVTVKVYEVESGLLVWSKSEIMDSGLHGWEVVGLEAGQEYSVVCELYYPLRWVGNTVLFKTGQTWWSLLNLPAMPFDGGIVKMLVGLLSVIFAGGVIAWKLRGSGGWQFGLVAAFALSLFFGAVRWFPVWIILLLTMILGLAFLWSWKAGLAGE